MRLSFFYVCCIYTVVLLGWGCAAKKEPVPDKIKDVVTRLQAPGIEEREAAIDDLRQMADDGLTPAESRAALREAVHQFPALEYEWRDSGSELVRAAGREPRSDHVPIILANYDRYSPKAKHAALGLLARLPGKDAATAFVHLVSTSAADLADLPTGTLTSETRHCNVLLPALLPHLANDNLRWGIAEICLACAQRESLDGDTLPKIASAMTLLAQDYREILAPLQQDSGVAWMWDEEYQEYRGIAALVLDVLGRTSEPDSSKELIEALDYADPRLQLFAVIGSLRNGIEVPPVAIENVAASAEVRNWFVINLTEIGRKDVFPARYATQEAFAESDMVNWLIYPTELATVPDQIELMKVVSRPLAGGIGDYYVFRFRTFPPHWAAEDGWMAGVSGPFLRKNAPSTESYGDTFSTFASFESKTPEEHVEAIAGLIEESRDMWTEQ